MFEESVHDRIEQLDAMRMGVEYRLPIEVRGFKMYVRPLTVMESVKIASDVHAELVKLPQDARNRLTEHWILARETLKLASTSDVDKNDPKITDLILSRMTNDEIHFLFKQYVAACDKVNPALELINTEEIEKLVEDIKKNNPEELAYQLTELSFLQLTSLAHFFLTKSD